MSWARAGMWSGDRRCGPASSRPGGGNARAPERPMRPRGLGPIPPVEPGAFALRPERLLGRGGQRVPHPTEGVQKQLSRARPPEASHGDQGTQARPVCTTARDPGNRQSLRARALTSPRGGAGEALNALRKPRTKCDHVSVAWWTEGWKEKLNSVIRRERTLRTPCP